MVYATRVSMTWILIILAVLPFTLIFVEGRSFDQDMVYHEAAAVRQRLSEVRQFLLPMSDSEWDIQVHHFATMVVPINSDSELCRNHSQHLLNNFLDQEIWALRMVDASSKFQSGILDGHLHNMGNYAQCISIREPNDLFRGQHCVLETTGVLPQEIADIVIRKGYPYIGRDGMFSLCVPSSCSDHDVITHVDNYLSTLGASSKSYINELGLSNDIAKINCSTGAIPFRVKDYIAMLIFATLVLVVIVSTIGQAKTGWLSDFSLSNNLRELMNCDTSPSDITCLSGLKVFFTLQIILGHRLFTVLFHPINRTWTVTKVFGTFTMANLELLSLAVNYFFFLGGLVLSFNFFMKVRRREDFNYLSFILKRYFRVTPVLAALALFDATLLIHSSHGPLWLRNVSPYEDTCHKNWWSSLLHISNLVNPDYTCVIESWFLACDFQLQSLVPALLLLILRRPRRGFVLVFLCFFLSMAALTAVAYWLQISDGYLVAIAFWDRLTDLHIGLYYKATIFRVYPFVMGVACGYTLYYYKQIKGFRVSKRIVWLGWTVTAAILTSLMLENKEIVSPDHEYNRFSDIFHVGVSRWLYCACLSWIIFACYFGSGGPLNSLLSWKGFRPLTKLGLSAFLVHINLQLIQQASTQSAITVVYLKQVFLYMGDVTASFLIAAVLYTTVEIPFYKLAVRHLAGLDVRPNNKKKQ